MRDSDFLKLIGNNLRLELLKTLYYNEGRTLQELCNDLRLPSSHYNTLLYHIKKLISHNIIYKDKIKGKLYLTKTGRKLVSNYIQMVNYVYDIEGNKQFLFLNDEKNLKIDIDFLVGYLIEKFHVPDFEAVKYAQQIFNELQSNGDKYYITERSLLLAILKTFLKTDSVFSPIILNNILVFESNIQPLDIVNTKKLYERLNQEFFMNRIVTQSQLEHIKNNHINIYGGSSNFFRDWVDGCFKLDFSNDVYEDTFDKLEEIENIAENIVGGINIDLSYKKQDNENLYDKDKMLVFWLKHILKAFQKKKTTITLNYSKEDKSFNSVKLLDLLSYYCRDSYDFTTVSELILKVEKNTFDLLNFDEFDYNTILHFPSLTFYSDSNSCITAFHCLLDSSVNLPYINSIVSINLPKIFVDAKHSEKLFYEKLNLIVSDIFKLFEKKYEICKASIMGANNPGKMFMNFFINLFGLFEYTYLLTEETIIDDINVSKEYNRLFGFLGKIIRELQTGKNFFVKLCSVDDTSSSYKFLDKDLLNALKHLPNSFKTYISFNGVSFGIIPPIAQFPPSPELLERIAITTSHLTGGYDCILCGLYAPEPSSFSKLLNQMIRKNVNIVTLNFLISICSKCKSKQVGFIKSCKQCGSKYVHYVIRLRNKLQLLDKYEIERMSSKYFLIHS